MYNEFCLIFFLIFFYNSNAYSVYDNDDIFKLAIRTIPIVENVNILETAWRNSSDLEVSKALHKAIYEDVIHGSVELEPKKQLIINEAYQQVREYIIQVEGIHLASIFSNNLIADQTIQYCRQLIFEYSYDAALPLKIYEGAIDRAYGFGKPQIIAQHLENIAAENQLNVAIQRLKVNAELYLYMKFIERGDFDDLYLLRVGYRFRQYQNNTSKYAAELQRRLDKAIQLLPTSLQQLYFEKSICLQNAELQQYLYVSKLSKFQVDEDRQNVITWYEKSSFEEGFFDIQLKPSFTNGYVSNITGILRHVWQRQVVYRDESLQNRIVSWQKVHEVPANSTWTLRLNNNKITFVQDEYLFCVTERYYGSEKFRRLIFGQQNPRNATMCEWFVDNCPDVAKKLSIN